jgi:hypothetical protein
MVSLGIVDKLRGHARRRPMLVDEDRPSRQISTPGASMGSATGSSGATVSLHTNGCFARV